MSLSKIGSLVVVGAGKMGLAMVRGWLKNGLDASALTLVDPSPSNITTEFAAENKISLVGEFAQYHREAGQHQSEAGQPDISNPEVLVLAIKPQIAKQAFSTISGKIGPKTLVLSVIAGFSLSALKDGLAVKKIVRTMPNMPAQVGKGVTGAIATEAVVEKDKRLANDLLSASGLVVWLNNEDQLNGVTAVSGSGPAYVFLMVEAMAAAGEAEGLEAKTAMVLARQTIIGAGALMEADPTEAAILRKNVTSPNGTTAAALKVLMAENGLEELMGRAIEAAAKRSQKLGE